MGSADQVQLQVLQELLDHSLGEGEADATIIHRPTLIQITIRVTPQDIAQQTLLGNDAWSLDGGDVVDGLQGWTQATMHAQNAITDKGTHRQAVEAVREDLPQLDAVASLALIVKAVESINGVGFVISSQDEEVVWVLHLVGEKETDGLNALLATIHIVSRPVISKTSRSIPQKEIF